jgi:hypothetical protein
MTVMKPRDDLKLYTLRHFLFYMAVAAGAGAVVGALANVMDWGVGLIYGVGLSVCALIIVVALREGLFGPPGGSGKPQHHRHA